MSVQPQQPMSPEQQKIMAKHREDLKKLKEDMFRNIGFAVDQYVAGMAQLGQQGAAEFNAAGGGGAAKVAAQPNRAMRRADARAAKKAAKKEAKSSMSYEAPTSA